MQHPQRVNRHSHVPAYLQVADALRNLIDAGRLMPGNLLPSLPDIGGEFGVSRGTAREALRVLLNERLIEADPGHGYRIRESEVRTTVSLRPGDRFIVRPATRAEQRRLRLKPGDPVIEIDDGDGRRVLAAYDVEVVVLADEPDK